MKPAGQLEAAMREVARRLCGAWPGRVAVAAHVRGTLLFEGPADEIYEAGSVTKVFVGSLLAEFAELGIISLSDPIASLLPGTSPALTMTLAEVASHTGGLPRLPGNFRAFMLDRNDPFAAYDDAALDAALATMKPKWPPGRRHVYTNFGFAVLGRILALRGGASVHDLLRARICERLGLQDSALRSDARMDARRLEGYSWRGRPLPAWSFRAFDAAGALKTTPRDLLRFVRSQTDPESPLARAFASARRATWRGRRFGLGLGWFLSTLGSDVEVWHSGATNRFASYAGFAPSHDVGVVLMMNRGLSLWGALVDNPLERAARQLLRTCCESA